MNLKEILTGVVVIAIAVAIGVTIAPAKTVSESFSGVNETYSFKNITSANASATSPVVVRGGAGTLGSITINTLHATIVRVYDGTATTTGTLIASIKASTPEQTLNYDVDVTRGIVLDVPTGFAGNYTVTYK